MVAGTDGGTDGGGVRPLADEPASWPVVESTDLHRDGWVMAYRADRLHRPDDPEVFRRFVLEHPGAVVVLAIDADDRVLVLRQYRHPVRRRLLELPAGLLDGVDEDPIDVARRELREEAGFEADTWSPLLRAYSSPGISEELIHYFLARDLREVGVGDFEQRHEEADLVLERVPFDDLLDAVLDGRTEDGPLAIAVLAHAVQRTRAAGGAP
ncbi:NUDIX hydrolase [Nocardioides fonticola]|uniref:NUDIX hydrolase n=1 Tax=Nocardioides fonticola TaxID=450363 RepID=A0ABP7XWQ0_9ACTN